MTWPLSPDRFALAWARVHGDRVPYPLAVRTTARDAAERARQRPALEAWFASAPAELRTALAVLAAPELRLEADGWTAQGAAAGAGAQPAPEVGAISPETLARQPVSSGRAVSAPVLPPVAERRAVRVLAAVAGDTAALAVQEPGTLPDRGGDVLVRLGSTKGLAAALFAHLPAVRPGAGPALSAPLDRVREDSRDLVTMPVAGPGQATRIRALLNRPRTGVGQIIVAPGAAGPVCGVLCWLDIAGDGRYLVHTRADVDIVPATPTATVDRLRPLLGAAAAGARVSR
ncbi:ESX secretion-associated protein EspG [Nocardia thailandica]